MSLSDARLAAQAAFVARRLVADGVVKAASPAEIRRALSAVLTADRERDRDLDAEVEKILRANAPAIRTAGADYAELFRKAKKMLADKKKIPL